MASCYSTSRVLTRLILVLSLLATFHPTEATAQGTAFRVVVLGSSTAEGANASPLSLSWVNQYAAHLATVIPGSEVINLGVGGHTTFNVMPTGNTPPSPWNTGEFLPATDNNITRALALGPDLIIINLPTNDCDLHVPIDQQMENYTAIVGAAAAQGVPVWISTTQPRNNDPLGLQLLRGMFATTYEAFPERTMDFWTGLADENGLILPAYNSDGTHLNNAGHAVLYDRAAATIVTTPPVFPSFAMHPRTRTAMENDSTSFVVLAFDSPGLTYRWQRNGVDIPNASSGRYAIEHAVVADSGAAYRCIVTNGVTSDTSNAALLHVRRLPPAPSGPAVSDDFSAPALNPGRWTFVDPLGDATATVTGSGTSNARLVISVPAATSHDIWVGANNAPRVLQTVSNADFEVETRFESALSSQYQMQGIIVQQDASTFLRFDFVRDASTTRFFSASFAAGTPTVRKDTAIANGSPLYLRVRRTGSVWTGSFSFDGTTWRTAVSFSQNLTVTAVGPFAGNHGIPESATPAFNGLVDYFFNTASPIVPEDGGQLPIQPSITSHPQSQTVTAGQPATFSVSATGTAPLTYAWQRDGLAISGANLATYAIPTSGASDSGASFRCVVSNGVGSATSDPAILSVTTVVPPASVVSDDFSGGSINTSLWTLVNPLGDASFSLTGTGTQDARLSIAIPGGVSHDLWTGAFNAPRILQSIPDADLSLDVRFESTLTSQYQFQGIIVQQDPSNFLRFDIVRDGSTTRFFSASFTGGTPAIRKDTAIVAGGAIHLRVRRQGSSWTGSYSLNGTSWITAVAFIHALSVTGAGPFAGNHGIPSSATPGFTALIDYVFNTASPIAPEDGSVVPVPPAIVGQPVNVTVTAGQPATFTVTATGTAPLTYQWQRNGVPIGAATSASYTIPATALSDSGATFRCVVTNSVNAATSNNATLTVVPPAAGLTSDSFNGGSLNAALWTFVDPRNDASVSMNGSQLRISVPAGTSHDLWTGDFNAPRVLQNVPNSDLSCEVKFDATMLSEYQFQGIIAQQDPGTFVRFDLVRDATRTRFFAASFNAGSPTVRKDSTIANGAPLYVRVQRTGNTWSGSFSYNGTVWTTGVTFSAPLTLTAIGPFAGNAGSTPPAFVALVDYFFNTASPLAPTGLLAGESELNDAGLIPSAFGLLQNYPNPFNPSTMVTYTLPVASQVEIRVFNTLGSEVATLVEGERSAGTHQAVFNAAGLPSGVYFCRMTAGTFSANRKLLLVR